MRILDFFQSLRGKLILTYTTVTVLALLAVELMFLLFIGVLSNATLTDTAGYLGDVFSVLPPQARLYLQPNDPDPAGLQAWLDDTYASGYASLRAQGPFDNPAAAIVRGEPMLVLDPDGTVLAAAPESARDLVGRPYTPPASVTRAAEILENARHLDLVSTHLAALRPDGRSYLVTVPVQQKLGSGPLAGVVVVTVKAPPPGILGWFPALLAILPATGVVLLCAVAPFGALFGFIMSRGLTRRLKGLTAAADAWSEGDFSVLPQDRSKDEISTLAGRMRRMAESIQALLHTRQELALLEERNRLARELHDTVKQETFATLMQVRAARNVLDADSAAARQHLEEAEKLIKASQQELGMIISELRPAALEGQGLAGALTDYLAAWSQHACIPAEIEVQDERRLPLDIEQSLFRVAQEALSNIARHSRASAANVRLTYEPLQVTLTISDNGAGFDPSASASGFGLQSMRERLNALGGGLTVQSGADQGTTLTARAPIPQEGK